ncbi:MAG: hypothetical protein WBP64_09675, partial [Nitrososphaeraceae archaeon]
TPTITARANITSYNVGEGAYVGLAIDSYDGFDMVNGRMTVRFSNYVEILSFNMPTFESN